MTHRQDNKSLGEVLEVLIEHGLDGMARAMEIIFNEAMKLERSGFLGAGLHERTSERRGYANGYKGKKVKSRVGELELKIPQVRDTESSICEWVQGEEGKEQGWGAGVKDSTGKGYRK